MRYGYLIEQSHLEIGLPKIKFGLKEAEYEYNKTVGGRPKEWSLPSIFRRLLIYDQLPDSNRQSVIDEIIGTLQIADPAFKKALSAEFLTFSKQHQNISKWEKIRQDHLQHLNSEYKRRNSENPYHTDSPQTIESWEELPVPERAYKNKPWQFDLLYRDVHFLALKIGEYIKSLNQSSYIKNQDRDLFRIRANSLLAADKIVFALNSGENRENFLDESVNIIDLKLSLDGLAIADESLQRLSESLQKLSWSSQSSAIQENQIHEKQAEGLIQLTEDIQKALRQRIIAIERRLMLFMHLEKDHY